MEENIIKEDQTGEKPFDQPSKNSNWKVWVKLIVTALALYWAFSQVDFQEIGKHISRSPFYLTFAAIVIYNLAKVAGSYRLNLFFREEQIMLTEKENLRLYYKGMFFNLFLPGGVGGDAYKGYYVHSKLGAPIKKIFRAIIWDRVSGVTAICFLGLVLACFIPALVQNLTLSVIVICAVLLYPCFWIITRLIMPVYQSVFMASTASALTIQVLQGSVVILLLFGMHVYGSDLVAYLLVYYVSTLATTLPITLGGIGIREAVFIQAAKFGMVDQNTAVALSILFFSINAFSSLAGAFIKVEKSNYKL